MMMVMLFAGEGAGYGQRMMTKAHFPRERSSHVAFALQRNVSLIRRLKSVRVVNEQRVGTNSRGLSTEPQAEERQGSETTGEARSSRHGMRGKSSRSKVNHLSA